MLLQIDNRFASDKQKFIGIRWRLSQTSFEVVLGIFVSSESEESCVSGFVRGETLPFCCEKR